jgi:ATP-dependent DNA helicase RecG
VDTLPLVEPVYPLVAGVAPRMLGNLLRQALERVPEMSEWIDAPLLARRGWPTFGLALSAAHAPERAAALEPDGLARARLAYDELLATQLAIAIVRRTARVAKGRAISGDGAIRRKALAALPFRFTPSQTQALKEIGADMAASDRMLRLLQGDVGSGKTVVALFAMLNAVECGGQAALMAPTEILARQHFETMAPLAEAAGVRLAVLTGRDKGAVRKAVLDGLSDGSINLVVGTHALFQEDVAFRDLMLAVVDEQHRFGVHQRLMLSGKGRAVDLLVMTATPIPRTLMLSAYGDLDVSRLTDKPPGRKPVVTRAVPNARIEEVVAGLGRAIAEGAQIYWVCPLVEESETLDLAAAEDRFVTLSEIYGTERVALVHGRLKPAAKDAAMARFTDGEARILVATTVIEVGVNVPTATVMVIEHAERFGLAQLHQLRGRIGRGDAASTCILLYGGRLSEAAQARLKTIRETEDGFRIAEEDLKLRGAGELLGTRQSGLPQFRLADLAAHADLMEIARDDAQAVLARDPELRSPRGEALRMLLYLFDRDQAVLTLRSG